MYNRVYGTLLINDSKRYGVEVGTKTYHLAKKLFIHNSY